MATITNHRSIVPHPDLSEQVRVLLVLHDRHWTLPRHATDDAEEIRAEMRERFGLEVTVLGAYSGHFTDVAREEPAFIFALETHRAAESLPDGARWIGHADLAAYPLADAEQRVALERWFGEMAGGDIPAERAPWERLGWFDMATAWVERQVAGHGGQAIGPFVQLHARGWSSVLRLPTTNGNVYFKAVTPVFGFEPPLTALLAELLPSQTPRVLAVDETRHWLLLADAGESLRAEIRATRDSEPYAQMLSVWARCQVALLPHIERIAATGLPDLRLAGLATTAADVLADADGLLVGRPGGLTRDEYEQLCALDVAVLAERLASFGIPETLVQEDCHPGHWIARADDAIFFDWGDCCLGHPFFSLMMALRWGRLVVGYDAATLERLRDAYLSQWSAYGSPERLREAYQLAWQLAPLMRALTWRRLVSHQEPSARWQYEDAPPYWMRLFLLGEDCEG
jgi:phosphotransferase family enzyme